MNWEMAKSWLISLFLVLDLLLGWQIFESRREMQGYVESPEDLMANTRTLLAEHGFSLQVAVPTDHPNMPTLHAQFASPSLQELTTVVFPKATKAVVDPSTETVTTSMGGIRLLGDGSWQVTYNSPVAVPSGTNLATLSYIWHADMYQPDPIVSAPGTYVMTEKYQTYPIFDAPIMIQLEKGGITAISQTALSNLYPASSAKPVISAVDALDNLGNAVDKASGRTDNRILKIDLGYARKVTVTPVGAPLTSSNYWFPVWRVVTDQQIYYINALSGEVDTYP